MYNPAANPMPYSFEDTCELVRACTDLHNGAAWQEFIRRFQKLIAGVIMRTCARWGEYSPNVVDDLVQETYLRLCANNCRVLSDFESRHPDAIFGYIKVIAANAVNDHFRSVNSEKRGGGAALEDVATVEHAVSGNQSGSEGAIEREVLLGQIESCLERCTLGKNGQRDRLIFRLFYFQRMTAIAIAALPEIGLSRTGVETVISRITSVVRDELAGESKAAAKAKVATAMQQGEAN